MEDVAGYSQYIEAPNTAYKEVTTRFGEVLQDAYRDSSLVNNKEGVKSVILKLQKTAEEILDDSGILSE